MFKKNKKQTETIKEPKEKKVRTVKVGTHKKTVIALWVVLIASVSFGVYKNFTAIDQHTTHEKEIIELRLQDTNGIENFVKNFAKSYYTWNNSKEAIEARTQAINGYLTKELQDLNIDTIRTDIPTSSTVTDVIVWSIEQSGTDTFSATYEVDQQIKEGEQTSNVKASIPVFYLLTWTLKLFATMIPTIACMWAVTVLFEKQLLSMGLNLLLIIPGVLIANTPLWLVYPYCYSGYVVSDALHTVTTTGTGSTISLFPFVPCAVIISVFALFVSIKCFGRKEMS